MGESKNGKKTKVVFALTALIILLAALVSVAFFVNQTSSEPPESGYWVLDISTQFSGLGYVQPNGTIQVPMDQTGITVNATATGINGFMHWRFDGEIVENQSSTIFVPKQALSSHHTLEAVFVAGTPVITPSPTIAASSEPTTSDARLLNSGYLKMPSLQAEAANDSKLFLVSATANFGIHDGQDCLIINASVRSDYTPEQPLSTSSDVSNGVVYFILHATLFSNGSQIEATEITQPHAMPVPGSPQHGLAPGGTGYIEMDMAVNNHNIDSYKIDLVALDTVPIP